MNVSEYKIVELETRRSIGDTLNHLHLYRFTQLHCILDFGRILTSAQLVHTSGVCSLSMRKDKM